MAAPNTQKTDYENSLIERAIQKAWKTKGNLATATNVASHLSQQAHEKSKMLAVMITRILKKGSTLNISREIIILISLMTWFLLS